MPHDNTNLCLSCANARALDQAAMEEYGIPGLTLMENAAVGAARLINRIAQGQKGASNVRVLAGPGNNGGDGWAIARLLVKDGLSVVVHSLGEPRANSDAATNAQRARAIGVPVQETLSHSDLTPNTIVVDSLFGTGLTRPTEGHAAAWITLVNEAETAAVLAIDSPSGLDADSGEPLGATVRATHTVTFVAPKCGFLQAGAAQWCGVIHTCDIGTPAALLTRLGTRINGLGQCSV